MLYGNESIAHYSPSNIVTWLTMSFQAGVLNIGGFMACHRFVSHVTGFATFFGFEMGNSRYDHALGLLAVPLFFLFGSMLSGQLVDIRLRLKKKPKYYFSFGLIFFLILLVLTFGVVGFFGPFGQALQGANDYVLLATLCLVCGIQNGTVTTVSRSVIRTTHLTGMTTDLGLGLVRVLNRRRLKGVVSGEIAANAIRIGIILFFGLGSVVGALVFREYGYGGFAVPAVTSGFLFFGTLYFQVFKGRASPLHQTLP